MEESNDNIKKTILVAEDVESNFLLLKPYSVRLTTFYTLTMVQKRSKCSITTAGSYPDGCK